LVLAKQISNNKWNNTMRKIGDEYWNYKGFDIYLAIHPKLPGKYEIYKGCDFVKRASTVKDCKQIILGHE
jgi:hypothetical protein